MKDAGNYRGRLIKSYIWEVSDGLDLSQLWQGRLIKGC